MFLVGGGILGHGIPWIAHWLEGTADRTTGLSGIEAVLSGIVPMLTSAAVGIVAGAVAVAVVSLVRRFRPGRDSTAHAG
jgi:predicted DNA repair protein MutK